MTSLAIQERITSLDLSVNPSFDILRTIMKEYKIESFLDYYLSNNPENKDCYHNRLHTLVATLDAIEGASFEKVVGADMVSVILAMLFHDSLHSCGKYPDSVNIDTACEDFKKAFSICADSSAGVHKSKEYIFDTTLDLIQCTKWPTPKTNNPDKPLQTIVRDADLMAIYQNKAQRLPLLVGLYNEMRYGFDVDEYSFLDQQATFATNIKWRTRWASIKSFKRNWPLCAKQSIAELELHFKVKKHVKNIRI